MEDDVLSKVIAAEKEIQQRLDLERATVSEWLDRTKAEQEERLLQEETRIKKETDSAIERAVGDAEARASRMLEEAQADSERLEKVDDAVLTGIILKHIVRILPGSAP